jgi:hypothetical protein
MKRIVIGAVAICLVLVVIFYAYIYTEKQSPAVSSYKNAEYRINGEPVQLKNGIAEIESAPGSASKITTRYFGNEYVTDLNSDGRNDIVFLLTQETGGSGIFYYVVSALNTEQGYVGSDGYLLGDRVAPQTIEASKNPRHQNVIAVNYAVRAPGEAMTSKPSIGKTTYLKLDTDTLMWGIVEPNFEGESR